MTGSDVALTLRSAATGAALAWRDLVRVSRPRTWVLTAAPFAIGAFDAERAITTAGMVGTLYALAPLNLLLHGADDAVTGRSGLAAASIWFAVVATALPTLLVLVLLGGGPSALTLALASGVALARALPPVRLRDQPLPDLVAEATMLALVALAGLLLGEGGTAGVPWPAVLAVGGWILGTLAVERLAGATAGTASPSPDMGGIGDIGDGDDGLSDDGVGGTGRRSDARRPVIAVGVLAAIGYALAAAAAAALGPLGALAGIGLALYLLLPAKILVGLGAEDEAGTATLGAAREARADRRGLDLLVGAWLVLLLLRHWGIVVIDAWDAAILSATVAAAYVLDSVVITAIASRRRPVPTALTVTLAAAGATPSLAIVVPCRDDIDRLPAVLAALRAQTYADTTVVVVDAGSDDGSAEEAAAWLGWDAVETARRPPPGWEVMDWARHVGALATESDVLLFVDPDIVLAPIAARVLMERRQVGGQDVLTGLPREAMPTIGERAAVPGFTMRQLGLRPIWWSAITGGRPAATAFADPSLLLVGRADYLEAVGSVGETPVTGGRDLARRLAGFGHRVGIVRATDLAVRRADRSVEEVVGHWRQVTIPHGRGGLGAGLALMLLGILAYVLPVALPPIAVVTDQPPPVVVATLVPLVVMLTARIVLAVTQRQPLISIVWHPVTVLVALLGQVAGIADHVRGVRAESGGPDASVVRSVT